MAKTEGAIFGKRKQLVCDLNLKLCGKELKSFHHLRYLGIYIDNYLIWSPCYHLSQKLVKVDAMFCKLHQFVIEATIKSIFYAVFHLQLLYVWSV